MDVSCFRIGQAVRKVIFLGVRASEVEDSSIEKYAEVTRVEKSTEKQRHVEISSSGCG